MSHTISMASTKDTLAGSSIKSRPLKGSKVLQMINHFQEANNEPPMQLRSRETGGKADKPKNEGLCWSPERAGIPSTSKNKSKDALLKKGAIRDLPTTVSSLEIDNCKGFVALHADNSSSIYTVPITPEDLPRMPASEDSDDKDDTIKPERGNNCGAAMPQITPISGVQKLRTGKNMEPFAYYSCTRLTPIRQRVKPAAPKPTPPTVLIPCNKHESIMSIASSVAAIVPLISTNNDPNTTDKLSLPFEEDAENAENAMDDVYTQAPRCDPPSSSTEDVNSVERDNFIEPQMSQSLHESEFISELIDNYRRTSEDGNQKKPIIEEKILENEPDHTFTLRHIKESIRLQLKRLVRRLRHHHVVHLRREMRTPTLKSYHRQGPFHNFFDWSTMARRGDSAMPSILI